MQTQKKLSKTQREHIKQMMKFQEVLTKWLNKIHKMETAPHEFYDLEVAFYKMASAIAFAVNTIWERDSEVH